MYLGFAQLETAKMSELVWTVFKLTRYTISNLHNVKSEVARCKMILMLLKKE